MRRLLPTFALAVLLLAAPAVHAAPTCQDKNGVTLRCGTPGAMPVGWTLPLDQRAAQPDSSTLDPPSMFDLVCILGGFFALIALMPDFDGWKAGDWDRQEGDDEEPR